MNYSISNRIMHMHVHIDNLKTMIVIYFLPLTWNGVLSRCGSALGNICCAGTYWDPEKSNCENCPLGFHNFNCTDICIYPTYGEECQRLCTCSLDQCDHRYGCRDQIDHNSTIWRQNVTTGDIIRGSSIVTENTLPGKTAEFSTFPIFVIYIIIAAVGIFLILCSLYVGTYIYKHCKKQTIIDRKGDGVLCNAGMKYNSLGLEINQQPEQSGDSMYLEPVSGSRLPYDEIRDQDETVEATSEMIPSMVECHDQLEDAQQVL